jgi:hypothetical protein
VLDEVLLDGAARTRLQQRGLADRAPSARRDVRRLQLTPNRITETMSPRVFRLGARVWF